MMKKLMEKFRVIRENQKKNGTKGFSMIELIIVIAVMAILIALIGTQLIPYLEKSRKTRDLDTLNAVLTAVQSVVTDHELEISTDLGQVTGTYLSELEGYLGYKWANCATTGKKYSSKAAKKGNPTAPTITYVAATGTDMAYIKVSLGDLFVASNGTRSDTTGSTAGGAGGGAGAP